MRQKTGAFWLFLFFAASAAAAADEAAAAVEYLDIYTPIYQII